MSWEWNKIFQRIWDDENFCTLPGDHQAVVFYLLTTKEGNRIGLYRLSVAMASEKLKVSQKVFRKRLLAVCAALHWEWDQKAGVLFIPTWFKYYPIAEGAKTNLTGYLTDLRKLPKTFLISQFERNQTFIPSAMKQLFLQQIQLHVGDPPYYPPSMGDRLLDRDLDLDREREEDSAAALRDSPSFSVEVEDTKTPESKYPQAQASRADYEIAYIAYPNHDEGKDDGWKVWERLHKANKLPALEIILKSIDVHKRGDRWKQEDGTYIPYFSTWLKGKRWTAEPRTSKRKLVL